MKEHIHTWLTEKMRVAGMLACGIRSPDRKTFTRSLSPQFAPVALENACRCLSDTFQILNSNRFPVELVRWVYENYFVYGFVRQDGHCLAVLTRRHEQTIQTTDLEAIVAEFHSLPTSFMPDPSFLDSPIKPTKSPVPPLSALEISGAICARVVHDLSNLVSGIIGNAEYAENSGANPENLKKAIHAISLSANSAGKLLGQCLPLQRLISGEATTCAAAEIARRISESSALLPGWHALTAANVTGQLRAQPRWLAATAWQIARETEVARGEIHISCGPAVFPVVWRGSKPKADRPLELFQVALHYRSEKLLFPPDGSVNPERFGLLAAHELINRFRGQIHARPRPPGRQEITILVPLL